MHIKKHLGFSGLRDILSRRFSRLGDHREKDQVKHRMHDVFMSALAMMFFQDRSLLEFQRRLQSSRHGNNLATMFHVRSIPKETQMRETVDEVDPLGIEPVFNDFFRVVQRGKYLEGYRVFGKYYLCVIDGGEYFGSERIECPACLTRTVKKKQGEGIRYAHQIVQPAIIHPKRSRVMPLCPEEVRNTDGREKQDCEINAGKRLLSKMRRSHPKLPLVITADGLFSKQPFVEEIGSHAMRYVLVAKPADHRKLMEWVNEQRILKEVRRMEFTHRGLTHIYEWINEVPLNDNKKTLMVNYFEYWTKEGERIVYHNSWITDFFIDDENVEELSPHRKVPVDGRE